MSAHRSVQSTLGGPHQTHPMHGDGAATADHGLLVARKTHRVEAHTAHAVRVHVCRQRSDAHAQTVCHLWRGAALAASSLRLHSRA
jgi:hypothetical protein